MQVSISSDSTPQIPLAKKASGQKMVYTEGNFGAFLYNAQKAAESEAAKKPKNT